MADTLSYTHTLMHGRYSSDLGDYAKVEARKVKILAKRQRAEDRRRNKDQHGIVWRACAVVWHSTVARFGDEWIFLAMLGIIMAVISFGVDIGVHICTTARLWLYRDIFNSSPLMQYWAWIFPSICLVLFGAGFTHLVAPQAVGSGIPEMKTILRGVVLKEYLTFKTLVAKVVGLVSALGSGMPIGKEGPFVHIASIVATLLSKLRSSGIHENLSRYNDMLAAGCAVGIGACFAAPIGGVLFSIEATTTYFAVRNCWRGFFAAVCGSSVFLLMVVYFHDQNTIKALFQTNFTSEFPFAPQELFVYSLMGVVGGFLGAGYVWLHRWYVTFIRSNKVINDFLQKNRFLYPTIIALIVATVSFPLGTGRFIGAELSTHEQLTELFSNFTFSRTDHNVDEAAVVSHWKTPYTSVFVNLIGYTVFNYIFSLVCYTLPVATGSFIPVFKIGAGFGRIFGELMHTIFPQGVWYGGVLSSVVPGGYAVVGAAAFSSAVTHTCSEAVIIFEITGQVTHVVPVMIASLIATAVAELLQPSMYDSMILIKKLPYLPDLLPTSSRMYKTLVDDFMIKNVNYIWPKITYQQLKSLLNEHQKIRCLPLVDSPENMILLGSVERSELLKMIANQIGREKRMAIAEKWHIAAEQRIHEEKAEEHDQELQQIVRRRSSRFEVLPAPDILTTEHNADDGNQSPKSILKKVNTLRTSHVNPYKETVYSARSQELHDVESGRLTPAVESLDDNQTKYIPAALKKVQLPRHRVIDMTPEDKKQWEHDELSHPINLDEHNVSVDSSPYQLVEGTPIIKVHTLFNMLGINHAYVTNIGRLVGVVGLDELRKAIEETNSSTSLLPRLSRDEEAKPLIGGGNISDKNVNTTITSVDSAFSVGSSEIDSEAKQKEQNLNTQ